MPPNDVDVPPDHWRGPDYFVAQVGSLRYIDRHIVTAGAGDVALIFYQPSAFSDFIPERQCRVLTGINGGSSRPILRPNSHREHRDPRQPERPGEEERERRPNGPENPADHCGG